MFKFRKSKGKEKSSTIESSIEVTDADNTPKQGWISRLSQGLKKTRQHFTSGLATAFLGKKTIDEEVLESLETILLTADVGIETSDKIIQQITEQVARKQLADVDTLVQTLEQQLYTILEPVSQPLTINTQPFVILMVGVNGSGKTTSIAKIAHYYQQQGKRIMLAAGDTFRAAAVSQLKVWGERNDVPVVAQHDGADSASVIYDAMESATAKNIDILIADTAGRLHTQENLMNELKKIKRVITKLNPNAPHETMLILDAGIGQNALTQAQQFHKAIGLDSITLTKLDGTAKGGILFSIADQMQLPIRFIGVGEQVDDLKPFDAKQFVKALFDKPETQEVSA